MATVNQLQKVTHRTRNRSQSLSSAVDRNQGGLTARLHRQLDRNLVAAPWREMNILERVEHAGTRRGCADERRAQHRAVGRTEQDLEHECRAAEIEDALLLDARADV